MVTKNDQADEREGKAGLRPYEFSVSGKSLRWYLKSDVDALLTHQAAPEAPTCTCPSGNGSLRWPCPQHPPGCTLSLPIRLTNWEGQDCLFDADNHPVWINVCRDGIDAAKEIVRIINACTPHASTGAAPEAPTLCQWPTCQPEAVQQQLAKEVVDSLYGAAAEAPASEQQAKCWSCKEPYSLKSRADADGSCPHCGADIELATPAATTASASGCAKCGSTEIHACPGEPIPEWTPEKIAEFDLVLSEFESESDRATAPSRNAAPTVKTWQQRTYAKLADAMEPWQWSVHRAKDEEIAELRAALTQQSSADAPLPDSALMRRAATVVARLYNEAPNLTDAVEAGDVIQHFINHVVAERVARKEGAAQAAHAGADAERLAIEAAAKQIYAAFPGADAHPWVEWGNSDKQEEARAQARAALAATEKKEPRNG